MFSLRGDIVESPCCPDVVHLNNHRDNSQFDACGYVFYQGSLEMETREENQFFQCCYWLTYRGRQQP